MAHTGHRTTLPKITLFMTLNHNDIIIKIKFEI